MKDKEQNIKKQQGNGVLPCVSGSINVHKRTRLNQRQVQSNSCFFNVDEDIIVIVDREKIIFKKPTIDYMGKTIKPKALSSGWVTFSIVADLPITKELKFDDEESTEDRLVVYYR